MLYPPHDFKCPYRSACPHLEWMSAKWALEAYQRADYVYDEHLKIVDNLYNDLQAKRDLIRTLEKENAELKAKLKLLHQRQFKSNKKQDNSGVKREESIPPASQEKKKRGAPMEHPGWVRPKPERIDRTIHVPAPTVCPFCQKNNLKPIEGTYEHIQEDIVIQPATVATQYLHDQAFCSRCNRPVVQPGEEEILNAPIGPVTSVYQRVDGEPLKIIQIQKGRI
ncbi:hypothetical protein PITCH_A640045 [uncultured Desulfobacterium sp.]|uniref:Transposase IS66 zinc-finger binding domain-containing protein n=1 Tax=uncultured Desulfobacterium sp. TaxID=201089 RepID=A0A445N1C5_9BACT|nr:hypothetical protein PITCH_A640045 [uncultured Desulfobacterium sp.]